MTSIEFTYFPTRTLGLIDFSKNIVTLIADFDLHAMFDMENVLKVWSNEFDFNQTFYSNSSSFQISSSLKSDGNSNFKLLYNSPDFSVSVNYEIFDDMPEGILQLTINGLVNTHHLVKSLNDICKKIEEIKSTNSQQTGPDDDVPNDELNLEKQEVSENVGGCSYFENEKGSVVYFFRINESDVTIGEYNRLCNQSGGAKDISFHDFIVEKHEQRFVLNHFGEDVLKDVIKTISTKIELQKTIDVESNLKFNKFKKKHIAEVKKNSSYYYFYIDQNAVFISEINKDNEVVEDSKVIEFEKFLTEKEGHEFITINFGENYLEETIRLVKSKLDAKKKELKKKVYNHHFSKKKPGSDSKEYFVDVSENEVTIGEWDCMNTQSGGSRSITFGAFLNQQDGHEFVRAYFDEEMLEKLIKIVKSKQAPLKEKSKEIIEETSYTKSGEGSEVYVLRINENDVSIGEFDHKIKDSGGTNEFSFKNFIDKKEGQEQAIERFGIDVLEAVIKVVKSRLKVKSFIKDQYIEIENTDGCYYSLKIEKGKVIISNWDPEHEKRGGSKEISFEKFLSDISLKDLVAKQFGESILVEAIKHIKSKQPISSIKPKSLLTARPFEVVEGSSVYFVNFKAQSVLIGSTSMRSSHGGGAREILFNNFLNKNDGHDFIKSHFGKEILEEIISIVKSRM